nr:hypothetical protein [Tanacetum cinerariifolium]
PKEDPAYYPADRGDNDDDESFNDDDHDADVEKDGEDKEEEEHLDPADPSDVSTNDLDIERVVAQRVANAIEAIAIYEMKTNLARKSMSQIERQEEEVAENASNKRKWESNQHRSLSQQNKGHKVPRAHIAWPINKKAHAGSLPLCNQCKFHHSGPCTNQQQPNKRQNTGRAYTTRHGEKKHTADLSRCVLNATITMMVHVLLNATSATDLA